MDALLKDIKYAIRGLRKKPGFSFVAIATLALGIGANTAIFSVVNTVLLKPLPFKDPDRLAIIWEEATFAGFPRNTPAPGNYLDWKTQNQSFEDVAATAPTSFNLTGGGEPERIAAYRTSANFFALLGVQPLIGRSFSAEEERPGSNNVALLSYQLWESRYGGALDILNRNIVLNGSKYTVVGVMPRGFQFLEPEVRLWVPLALTPEESSNRGAHYLTVIGRLKPTVSIAQAQAEMSMIMSRIAVDHADETFNGKLGAVVLSLADQLVGESRRPLLVLLVAVAFVLLIACANMAGLLLARAASRKREIALRVALGASRMRVVRQLLTESLLLASLGGFIGALLAAWSFSFLQRLVPESLANSASLHLDLRVLGFALLISVVTGILFGLVPALQAAKVDLNESLKQTSSRSTSSLKLRNSMIVFEVALSLVLLVGAGLLIQTLFRLFNQYSGLQPESVLTLRTVLPLSKYELPEQRTQFYQKVLDRVQYLPGVVAAGYTTSVPLSWKGGTSGFYPEGLTQPSAGLSFDANHREVSSNYLQALRVPLLKGRYFTPQDNDRSVPVVIINETMARQYWPGSSALGRRIKLGDPAEDIPWFEIVGIVGDVRQMGLTEPIKAEMYLPYQQITTQPWFVPRDLAIRTTGDPTNLVGAVREVIREVDPDQPISNVATMSELLGEEASQRRVGMIMLTAFSILALLLAVIGIYGVLAYFVSQRTSEIGVRLALGATPRDIMLMILRRGMILTLLGVSIGLFAAYGVTRLMSTLLFEVKAADPLTFMVVPILLTIAALFACAIPARKAMKVEPLVALRYE